MTLDSRITYKMSIRLYNPDVIVEHDLFSSGTEPDKSKSRR